MALETTLPAHRSSVWWPTEDPLIWLEGLLNGSHLEKYHHLEVYKISVFPVCHSVMTPQGQEIQITTLSVQRLRMQTFWRKPESFGDKCPFDVVPLPLICCCCQWYSIYSKNGGRLKKRDLITCGYKLICARGFHSSRLKNTHNLFRNK